MSDKLEMILNEASEMKFFELDYSSTCFAPSKINDWWNKCCDADDYFLLMALMGCLDSPL